MKLAANRMMKILDQAKRLAPQSVTGALSPVQERTMQQAEALMAHPATSRLSQSALERPKTLFDHYVSVQPRPQGNLHDLLAEASNPATSAARLGELASTPFREVVEAAAVNPNAGAELSRVHQLRPDLAEKNPATALMRMMDPLSSPPKMNEWEMRAFKSDLRSKGNRRFHENLWDHVFTQRPLRIGNERVEARTDHKDMLGGRRPGRPGWNISTLSDPGSRALQALERSPRSQELESLRFPSEKRAFLREKTAAPKNVTFAGVPVRIDRPKGFVQKGVGPDGNVRYRTYHADYGYIPGTKGGDGEGFDVFLGPKENGRAFLIHQKKDDGTFDEFKLMLGYADPQSAKAMYLKHIPQKYMGSFQEVPVAMIQGLRGKEVNHKQIMMKKAEAVWDSFFDNIE